DLLPYVCTFAGCNDELRQFPSRKAWSEHEMQEHRSRMAWACPECPFEGFTGTAWSAHVQEAHGRAFAALQNSSAADAARRKRPRPIDKERCCLCNEDLGTDRDIRTHVGKHMEEIALMALPKEPEESSDDSSNSDTEASRVSELAQEKPPSNLKYECPVTGCKQLFLTQLEKNDHALTHYQRPIVCNFCPSHSFIVQRTFDGIASFKQHLISIHEAGLPVSADTPVTPDAQTSGFPSSDFPPSGLPRSGFPPSGFPANALNYYSECPVCESPFLDAQSLYKHLDECGSYALTSPQALVSRWDDTLKTERYRPSPAELQRQFSSSSNLRFDKHGRGRGICPNPGCGRFFKDLKLHMLTHESERPEKCPVVTCEYHEKGFARKYDRNRHTLTHLTGLWTCHFCPDSGSGAEKYYTRVDVFKRHLTSVHGVEQTAPDSRRKKPPASPKKPCLKTNPDANAKCLTCSATFGNPQEFYDHLDACVSHAVEEEAQSKATES
ncbi:MAG: hypothetical protein Q9191_007430, partial [Dirinaria sp. TL-2023a]